MTNEIKAIKFGRDPHVVVLSYVRFYFTSVHQEGLIFVGDEDYVMVDSDDWSSVRAQLDSYFFGDSSVPPEE